MKNIAFLIAAVFLCPAWTTAQDIGVSHGAVVNGHPSSTAEELATIALLLGVSRSVMTEPVMEWVGCTGTAISSTLILTAAHCVEEVDFIFGLGTPILGIRADHSILKPVQQCTSLASHREVVWT